MTFQGDAADGDGEWVPHNDNVPKDIWGHRTQRDETWRGGGTFFSSPKAVTWPFYSTFKSLPISISLKTYTRQDSSLQGWLWNLNQCDFSQSMWEVPRSVGGTPFLEKGIPRFPGSRIHREWTNLMPSSEGPALREDDPVSLRPPPIMCLLTAPSTSFRGSEQQTGSCPCKVPCKFSNSHFPYLH